MDKGYTQTRLDEYRDFKDGVLNVYTITSDDTISGPGIYLCSGSTTLTLSASLLSSGEKVVVIRTGTNNIAVAGGGVNISIPITGNVSSASIRHQYASIEIIYDGTQYRGRYSSAYSASGVYTPTLTGVQNVTASTAYECQWMLVGSVVTVSGKVEVDPTLGSTSTRLGISLPISSSLTADYEVSGVAACPDLAGLVGAIIGDATNDRAQLQYETTDTSNRAFHFTFTYIIK